MSQNQQILRALQRGECISPLDALDRFHCLRLGARIYDLRQQGYNIQRTLENRYAVYYLRKCE